MSNRQPDWVQALRVGDVLTRNGRTFRVVRDVWHYPDGRVRGVTFTIKRRSWTGRAYTCYDVNTLLQLGFRPVGARVKLTSELDARIARCIAANEFPGHYSLTPEDVQGVA